MKKKIAATVAIVVAGALIAGGMQARVAEAQITTCEGIGCWAPANTGCQYSYTAANGNLVVVGCLKGYPQNDA